MASDDILERSLRLLDDAFGTPSQRMSMQMEYLSPRQRQPKFTNRPALADSSSVLNMSPYRSINPKERLLNLSLTMNQSELSALFDYTGGTTIAANKTNTTGIRTTLMEGPDRLYQTFLDTLQTHSSSHQVFDTIKEFTQNCSDMLDLLQEKNGRFVASKKDIAWLENERNHWRLVYCLYQNRLMPPDDENIVDNEMDVDTIGPRQFSEKEIVMNYYKSDNTIRECQLVIDWLEKTAADQHEAEVTSEVSHYTDKTVAWENTLYKLQNEQIAYNASRPIITAMDPDAPLRQNKPLHDIDMEDEARLLAQVFKEIRCGKLEKAQALCIHCGQAWRAATLEGWRLYHDPNYGRRAVDPEEGKLPVEGNPNRDTWKLCAWRLSEDVRSPPLARAIYASFCGNLSALLPVCRGWEDLLWAHIRVLVDVCVEKEIRSVSVREYVPMPDSYWNFKMTISDIFKELDANPDCEVNQETLSPDRIIQKLIILDTIPELMSHMSQWIQSDSCQPHLIRFLAHLVLILRLLGKSHSDNVGDEVLKAYVKVLIDQGDPQLVAYYVATLPQEDQVTMYADFLENITNSDERRVCLEAAEMLELQVEAITQRVVENIRNKESKDSQYRFNLLSQTTEEDLTKISALDWVIMYPQQRAEAMWQTNALIRTFLSVGKLEAARMAFTKIPPDSVQLVLSQNEAATTAMDETDIMNSEQLPQRVAASVREYLCHKAYLDAQEGFSDWFQHYHHAKPTAPVKPSDGASFTEKVAYDHRLTQYNKELDRWKAAMAHQTKCVKSQLYNVLLFPDGGWLSDSECEDQLRQQQMKSLRTLCIPKVVLLLHTVLQGMGEYAEALQLADLVVSEQYKLYEVYMKQELEELLKKLCESSLALLDQNKDPWGHPVSF